MSGMSISPPEPSSLPASPTPSTSRSTSTVGSAARIVNMWSFTGKYRVLHLTWIAFFLTFVVWFNFAPFANTIAEQVGLSSSQKKTIGLVNVALTVPARVFVGMALDRWGPRRVYSTILMFAVVPNTWFALSTSFESLVLSRLALSIVGAGFVVGIRMVSEWFPPSEIGTAEGVYGGWGNFGSAAAAFTLPVLAGVFGGDDGWRYSIALTGFISAAYGLYYLRAVTDTPAGVPFAKPRRQGALEVTSRPAVLGLMAMTVPINAVLALIAWRIWTVDVISTPIFVTALAVIVALLLIQEIAAYRVNRPAWNNEYPAHDRYPMRSVAVLCLSYFATFGSELAVVSMLPTFFADTWGLAPTAAGIAASAFAFMNLGARPAGGMMSDLLGARNRTLTLLLVGLLVGYVVLATMGAAWPWGLAVVACMGCSFFVQAGEGAVFAIVPMVKKRVSGQVAGLAGAYGNVGAVVFLTVGLYVSSRTFFLTIAAASVVAALSSLFLVEPEGSFASELATDDSRAHPAPQRRASPIDGQPTRPALAPAGSAR
jgi:NNP family nitrate/nitrite transporter-like MFS transporter